MALTDEQNRKIATWLSNKTTRAGTPRECSACGQVSRRGIHDDLVFAPVLDGSALNINKGALLVAVECDNCGAHQFFSAKAIGVAP